MTGGHIPATPDQVRGYVYSFGNVGRPLIQGGSQVGQSLLPRILPAPLVRWPPQDGETGTTLGTSIAILPPLR
jgi:hypothetical protein